ncbi:MAG: hypothetical protein methR_P3815 [Methyloprofundus sp.]|nr:MAG: hypothetical protein methR_P3815 [Methyloprofundus sp.]
MKFLLMGALLYAFAYAPMLHAETTQDLFIAAIQGKQQRVQNILVQGIDVNGRVASGRTALMAAAYSGNFRIAKLLLTYGANVNLNDKQGNTALMDAIIFGDPRIVKLLITGGADVNVANAQGEGALEIAKKTEHKPLLKILESAGAKQQVSTDGETEQEATEEVPVQDGAAKSNEAGAEQKSE